MDGWLLRPAVLDDAEAVAEAFADDPEMARQGPVTDVVSARRYLERLTDTTDGRHAWVAVEGSGPARALVGVSVDAENRLGWFFYWCHRDARGGGVTRRAARAVAGHALSPDGMALERLELGHRVNNPASGGVATAAGFVLEGREREKFLVDGKRVDVLAYGRLRSDPAPQADSVPPLLSLRPLAVSDASAMSRVLSDPVLYGAIGGEPPSREALEDRYARLVVGRSDDGTEEWVNDVVLLDGASVGYVLATVTGDEAVRRAELAWVVGAPWQGRGVATQAARLLVDGLRRRGVIQVSALIAPGHAASEGVARGLGMTRTDVVVDGEVRWHRTL